MNATHLIDRRIQCAIRCGDVRLVCKLMKACGGDRAASALEFAAANDLEGDALRFILEAYSLSAICLGRAIRAAKNACRQDHAAAIERVRTDVAKATAKEVLREIAAMHV
jgi:hypothetical protein